MANFWRVVNKVIQHADVLLLLLDARLVDETRNAEIEDKVNGLKKPLIYVITKCDLVEKEEAEKQIKNLKPSVFVSSKEHLGTTILREQILIEAKRFGIKNVPIHVGVLGYPNVGKSSLINALKGRKSASTSVLSGHTKGIQKIKADNRIVLLDTPGVIPYKERDFLKHTLIGTIDYTRSKEPDLVVMKLMEKLAGKIEEHYSVEVNDDKEKTIEDIAIKFNILVKGGKPDILRAARKILMDWQKGLINKFIIYRQKVFKKREDT